MKHRFILYLLILIGNTYLSAQDEIVNNVHFAERAIKKIVIDSLMTNAIPKEKKYRLLSSGIGKRTLFVTNAVKEALDEAGYNAKSDDDVDSLDDVVEMKILDPEIKFEVRNGLRKISGTFKLLLYSKSNGDIIWGKEMDLSFREEDSVKGVAVGSLEQGAPDFLTIKNESQFSSSKVEKILAGVVAGIITYLLYSVRS